jgi:drug/metabolite transporter (DMT)-like permease
LRTVDCIEGVPKEAIPVSHPLPGHVLVLAGAFITSWASVLVRVADVSPSVAAFYRTLIGAVVLAVWLVATGGFGRLSRNATAWHLAATICFALDLLLWHRSIHLVGPGLATILANFQVFVLAVFGVVFLREALTFKFVVAAAIAVLGLGMIFAPDWDAMGVDYRAGVFYGLAAAVAYAAYLLTLRRARSHADAPKPLVTVQIVAFGTAVLMGTGASVGGESFVIPNGATLAALIALGLLVQVGAWGLITTGIARAPASKVGLLLLLQPGLSFIWDVLLFDRATGPTQAFGAVLALSAIYLGTTARVSRTVVAQSGS